MRWAPVNQQHQPPSAQQAKALCRQLVARWLLNLTALSRSDARAQALALAKAGPSGSAGHRGRQLHQRWKEASPSTGFKERLGEYLWVSPKFLLLWGHYEVNKNSFSTRFLFNLYTSKQAKQDCRVLASRGTRLLYSPSLPLPPPRTHKAAALHAAVLLQRVRKKAKGHAVPAAELCIAAHSAGSCGLLKLRPLVQSDSGFGVFVPGSQQGALLFRKHVLIAA